MQGGKPAAYMETCISSLQEVKWRLQLSVWLLMLDGFIIHNDTEESDGGTLEVRQTFTLLSDQFNHPSDCSCQLMIWIVNDLWTFLFSSLNQHQSKQTITCSCWTEAALRWSTDRQQWKKQWDLFMKLQICGLIMWLSSNHLSVFYKTFKHVAVEQ